MPNYTGLAGTPYPVANPIGAGLATAQQVVNLRNSIHDQQAQDEDRTQRRGLVGLQMQQAQLGVDKAKQEADDDKGWRDAVDGYLRFKERYDALSDPDTAQQAAGLFKALHRGDPTEVQKYLPQAMPLFNRLNGYDNAQNLGEKRPGTDDTIVDKTGADFLYNPKRGKYHLELNVTAQKPDGSTYVYQAPRTEGENTKHDAPVREWSEDQLMDHVAGAAEMAMDIHDGKLTMEPAYKDLRAAALRHGKSAADVDAIINRGMPKGDLISGQSGGKQIYARAYTDNTVRDLKGNVLTDFAPYDAKALPPDLQARMNIATVREAERKANAPDETWATSSNLIDANGNPLMLSNRGSTRAIPGAHAAPKGGMSVTLPDGTQISEYAVPGGLTKPNQTKVQDKVMSTEDQIAQLRQLGPKISSDYLTYVGRGKATLGGLQDKLGMNTDNAAFNADRAAALQGVEQFFNAYRKDITGAAAAEKELADLKKAVINSDIGPQEFERRYNGLLDSMENDLARNKQRLGDSQPVQPTKRLSFNPATGKIE